MHNVRGLSADNCKYQVLPAKYCTVLLTNANTISPPPHNPDVPDVPDQVDPANQTKQPQPQPETAHREGNLAAVE